MNGFSYSQLLDREEALGIAESASSYEFLTERHLQAIWFEQKYFRGLQTTCGKEIRVVSPGIWNAEAGPDFKRAHLIIGEQVYIGDVEIHLADEGWTQHGHHTDGRYDNVILHLSFWLPREDRELKTIQQKTLLKAYLEPYLTIPKARILQLIDLDLYPYKQFLGSGKCAHSLFKKMPCEEAETLFTKAAEWRLTQKRQGLQQRTHDPRMALVTGIAMALGYKRNSEPFCALYQRLTQYAAMEEEALLAYAMGVCGFFSSAFQEKWCGSSYYNQLLAGYNELEIPKEPIKLDLAQVRPLNHPVRRIAYMTKLVGDFSVSRLFQKMEGHWSATWPLVQGRKEEKALAWELCSLIPSYEDPYWNFYYTFDKDPQEKFLPLMGAALKEEILVNAFLPLLQEQVTRNGNRLETKAFKRLCLALPAHATGKSKYLSHRFFGETEKGALLKKNAFIQQGAYQLHRDFCVHYEASCEGCPFVDRYSNL